MPKTTGQGALTEAVFYILLAVYEPTHGYGIIKFIRSLTESRVILGSGTLYGAIKTLLRNRWIKISSIQNNGQKLYEITDSGKEIVAAELLRLRELLNHGNAITGGV